MANINRNFGKLIDGALTYADGRTILNPNAEAWNALLDGAANALGKTRAEIDAFLDAIPTEG